MIHILEDAHCRLEFVVEITKNRLKTSFGTPRTTILGKLCKR